MTEFLHGWDDAFGSALALFVSGLLVIDFAIGKRGRVRLQRVLENVWLHLSYVSIPTLGLDEAQACLKVLDRLFGSKLWSWRRWVSTTILVAGFISLAYLILEASRLLHGLPVRWPFIGIHWDTGFPIQILPAALSISAMRFVLSQSVARLGDRRLANLFFFMALIFTAYFSIPLIAIFNTLVPTLTAIAVEGPIYGVVYVLHLVDTDVAVAPPESFLLRADMAIKVARFVALVTFYVDPFVSWKASYSAALSDSVGYMTRAWYDFVVIAGFGMMRLAFAVAFIGSWVLLVPLRWLSSLLLLRLIEADRGALTALGAAIAFVAKLTQQIAKMFTH